MKEGAGQNRRIRCDERRRRVARRLHRPAECTVVVEAKKGGGNRSAALAGGDGGLTGTLSRGNHRKTKTCRHPHILKNEQKPLRSPLDILRANESQTRKGGSKQDKKPGGKPIAEIGPFEGIMVAWRSIVSAVRVCTSTYQTRGGFQFLAP